MKSLPQCAVAIWLFSSLLVCRGSATDASQSPASSFDSVIDFRLRSQNLHVDYLEKELEKLERELNEWKEPSVEDITWVKARIQRLESWFNAILFYFLK